MGAGGRDRVSIRPDRVFQHAVRLGAGGVVFSHNHLNDTGPSAADHAVTRRLVAAGHLLGIPLLASLVVEPGVTHDLVSDRTWCS
ncbi:MAG: JAB domain-containing protein [Pseudonocardiaceae bacterium]